MTTAAERALKVYPRSAGFQGAYVKGAEAARHGKGKLACPYRLDLGNTWRRAYRLAWMRGWYSVAGVAGDELGEDLGE